jgi:hypothetical protein
MTADDRTRPAEEELHLGRVALNLGLVGPDELQLALDAQEELKAAGIHTLIGDVMLDLRLITAEQRERALTEQDRLLHQAGLLGKVRGAPTVGWLVAALVPALSQMPPSAVLAWSGAILLGLALAPSSPLRWVGLGWITAVVAPGSNPAAIAGSGSLLHGWRMHLGTVLLGAAVGLLPFPGVLQQAGPLLLVAAAGLALFRRVG